MDKAPSSNLKVQSKLRRRYDPATGHWWEKPAGRAGRWSLMWTPDTESLLRRLFPVTPNAELMDLLGVKHNTFHRKVKAMGLRKSETYLRRNHEETLRRAHAKLRSPAYRKHLSERIKAMHAEGKMNGFSANTGHPQSEETRQKIAESNRRRWRFMTPAQKKAISEKRSAAAKRHWASLTPGQRADKCARMKAAREASKTH